MVGSFFKDMMARVTMLAMHRDGVIVLPPPKGRQYRPKPIVFGPDTEPPLFWLTMLNRVEPDLEPALVLTELETNILVD